MIRSLKHPELQTCASTQDEARRFVENSAPEPTLHWVLTKQQTQGRGRQGAPWQTSDTPENQLITSVAFKSPALESLGPLLSLLAGHALFLSLSELAPALQGQVFLKWPNDLYARQAADTPLLKLAGILAERHPQRGTVIGFGVNLAWSPSLAERSTGHLGQLSAGPALLSRISLWNSLIRHLELALTSYVKDPTGFRAELVNSLRQESMHQFWALEEIVVSGKRIRPLGLAADGALEAFDLDSQTTITLR